ncbi:restriction endonuclease subunit S [Rhizobium leguminosarum]|uniref:restriction endonuclease subunit S n=1 Tax=Rhizobium leguminosarum TaxID=384 RepID=UPI000FEC7682|nr:restriction endonuclease subunit S [Rhizobium leguminosarum]RWX24601.1 restriction endonuclease subunit S [Rhizobium leguminosarum]
MSYRSPFSPLPHSWTVARLRDLTSKIGSGATPRGGEQTYLKERNQYALIRSQCVHDRRFDASTVSYISDEQAKALRNAEVRPGDVLINITGDGMTFARSSIVPDDVLPACVNQHVAIVRPIASLLCSRYLMSFLASPEAKPYIESFNAGGSRRAITKGHIESFEIPLPPLAEQVAIGSMLGSLDDKIELNRRTNETLEAMAQAIFRDWFVDFGPTRRKLDGATNPITIMGGLVQDAGRAQALADLFPAKLGDGLPEGWSFKQLEESIVLQRGFDLPKPSRTDGAYPVIAASGPSGTHAEFRVKAPGVCTGRSGVLGKVFYVQQDFWPLNTSLWIKAYPNATPIYAYFLLREIDMLALNAGSAVPTLNRNHVHNRPTVTPPMAVIDAYTGVAEPLMVKSDHAAKECETLAATRDLLLPKIMSGEIRLAEGDELLEAAQ